MDSLIKTNKCLGWILIFGFIVAQSAIFYFLDPHVILVALIPLGIFLPFFVIACLSVLNRTKYERQITTGVRIGIILTVGIPTLFPLLFDFEFIYISLIGIGLGILVWYLRKSQENQLLILNSISCILLLLLIVAVILDA